jgi:hypothetical protein
MRCLKGSEQGGDHQGGDDYGQLRLLLLPSYGAEDSLGRRYAPDVDERKHRGERTVDEGTVYESVYIIESVAEDGYPYGALCQVVRAVSSDRATTLRLLATMCGLLPRGRVKSGSERSARERTYPGLRHFYVEW